MQKSQEQASFHLRIS